MIYVLAQESGDAAKSGETKLGDVPSKSGESKSGKATQGTQAKDGKAADGKAVDGKTAEAKTTESAEVSGNAWYDAGALGLLLEGGFFMWPILLLGVLAAGVMIERFRSLKMLKTDAGDLRSRVLDHLHADDPEQALALCESQQGPVPAILSSGLRRYVVLRRLNYDPARIENQVIKTMEDYGVHVVAALERHLPILATVSSVAPMIGFLGTVAGMIESFAEIVATMGEKNIVEAAASGIQTALLTTCFGLIIGIPAFMAFNYFTGVINRFVLDVEESAAELMEAVTLKMTLDRGGDVVQHLPGEDIQDAPQASSPPPARPDTGGPPSADPRPI